MVLGNAVAVLDKKKIIDLFIDPPQILIFILQTLLLKQKFKGEYLKGRLLRKVTQWKSGIS